MKFNEKLKQLREERQLEYEDVAKKVYVAPRAVKEWEQGKNYPSVPLLMRLSKFYGLSMEELLAEDKAELPIDPVDVQGTFLELRFGDKVQVLRKQIKMTRAVFSEKTGLATKTLELWETGDSLPNTLALMKVSKLLSTPMDELLSEELKELQ